jgi:hypothetical protein
MIKKTIAITTLMALMSLSSQVKLNSVFKLKHLAEANTDDGTTSGSDVISFKFTLIDDYDGRLTSYST